MVIELFLENAPWLSFTREVIEGPMVPAHYQTDGKGTRGPVPTAQNVLDCVWCSVYSGDGKAKHDCSGHWKIRHSSSSGGVAVANEPLTSHRHSSNA